MYPYVLFLDMGLYDILITIGLVLSLVFADRMGEQRGFSTRLQRLVIFSALGAFVVGFLGAVLFQAFYNYMETGVFVIDSQTGMTFYGGLIFGILGYLAIWFGVGKLYCKDGEEIKRFGDIADIAACVIPMAHGLGRIGCLFAGCCHGGETDAWYGIFMHTEKYGYAKVVPVQLFEALFLFALSAAAFVMFYRLQGEKRLPILPIYTVGYGIWRFFIEFLRGDRRGETIVSFLSPSQLVGLIMIGAGIVYFVVWYLKIKKKQGVSESNFKE